MTVGLLVDRLELKNETDIRTLGNIVPDNWIYVQDASVKLGRIQIFNNWSPYSKLLRFFACSGACPLIDSIRSRP